MNSVPFNTSFVVFVELRVECAVQQGKFGQTVVRMDEYIKDVEGSCCWRGFKMMVTLCNSAERVLKKVREVERRQRDEK